MKNLNLTKPFSDNILTWDGTLQRYSLTPQYVKANFEITFTDDGVLTSRISKNSRKIYNWIYSHIYSGNRSVVEKALNGTIEGRRFLIAVLTEQIEADLNSGYNDLSMLPSINTATGQAIDRNLLLQNQLSVDAENIIDANTQYFGFNLFYMGCFPYSIIRAVNL